MIVLHLVPAFTRLGSSHLPAKETPIDANEIILINDGDGMAAIGEPSTIERFFAAEDLSGRDMELPRMGSILAAGSGTVHTASEVTGQSGRWIKLSEKSAQALAKGTPMKGSEPGLSRAILTENGRTKAILEFASTPGTALSNPAVLAGAAGLMAQLAMQQTMSEITDYLATIDAKLDDVLRGQKDAVLADMVGVGLVIEEAMTIREGIGGVSEITWSKVQSTALTIARTQAYALAQIDDLTAKLVRERQVDDIADVAREMESRIQEWLAVLARCFQLQDGMGVLELDRLFSASPEQVDDHRRALRVARQNRKDRIATSTEHLLGRLDEAARTANAKVLMNPLDSRNVLASSHRVANSVTDFHSSVGILGDREGVLARRWREAAMDVKDTVAGAGRRGAGTALRLGGEALGRARSGTSKVSRDLGERIRRSGRDDDSDSPEPE